MSSKRSSQRSSKVAAKSAASLSKDTLESIDWTNLIGYEHHLKRLASLNASSYLPASLLIEGREGIGKRVFAGAVAALSYCIYGLSCGKCEGCRSVINDDNPDLLWLEPTGSSLKIDDVRRLQEHLEIMPSYEYSGSVGDNQISDLTTMKAPSRVAVITDVDKLTEQAANCLLKTLEEPFEHAKIILTTSKINALLPTVLSRVIKWHINPPSIEESISWLEQSFQKEGLDNNITREEMVAALHLHGLAPGLAYSNLVNTSKDDSELDNAIAQLLFSQSKAQALDVAEYLGKNRKLSMSELLSRIEIVMNQFYKRREGLACDFDLHLPELDKNLGRNIDLKLIRSVIRDARRVGGRNKIALNVQLFLEALAFPNTGYKI